MKDDFEDMGLTPELTQAARDLSIVNTGIIMLKKAKEANLLEVGALEEIEDAIDRLEKVFMPIVVAHLNDMIRREEVLKKGL